MRKKVQDSPLTRKVLEYLQERHPNTRSAIVSRCGTPNPGTVDAVLKRLVEEGYVCKPDHGCYTLTAKGESSDAVLSFGSIPDRVEIFLKASGKGCTKAEMAKALGVSVGSIVQSLTKVCRLPTVVKGGRAPSARCDGSGVGPSLWYYKTLPEVDRAESSRIHTGKKIDVLKTIFGLPQEQTAPGSGELTESRDTIHEALVIVLEQASAIRRSPTNSLSGAMKIIDVVKSLYERKS